MELRLNEDQSILKETVSSFIVKEFPEAHMGQLCKKKEYPHSFDIRLAQLGLLGVCIPQEYNGSNLGAIEFAIILEELSRYSVELGMSFGLNVLGGLTILKFGTENQKKRYLPKLIKGEMSFSVGYGEPFFFSDLNKIIKGISPKGGKLRLNGATIFSEKRSSETNYILLPVLKEEGLVVLYLPQKFLSNSEEIDTLGRNLLSLVKYEIEDMDCSEYDSLLQGQQVLSFMVNWMKVINLMCCIGNMGTVIEKTIKYSKERIQFGKPIGTFQSLQHLIVDTKVKADASRLFGYWIAWLLDKNHNERQWESLIGEINMANTYITQSYIDAVNTGLQVMGGYGYMQESYLERYIRDARMATFFVEDSFLQKKVIFDSLGIVSS